MKIVREYTEQEALDKYGIPIDSGYKLTMEYELNGLTDALGKAASEYARKRRVSKMQKEKETLPKLRDLAQDKFGVSGSYVYQIVKGTPNTVSESLLKSILEFFSLNIDDFNRI